MNAVSASRVNQARGHVQLRNRVVRQLLRTLGIILVLGGLGHTLVRIPVRIVAVSMLECP